MFGLGGSEILLVLLLAMIFIGPKDLPKVAFKLGEYYRKFKHGAENLSHTFKTELAREDKKDLNP